MGALGKLLIQKCISLEVLFCWDFLCYTLNMVQDVRVRIAPSPTGLFHIGTARSSLFNYVFAKQNKGTFVLRIEDTDKERSKPEFEKSILDGLSMLGLKHDEFYRQSERTAIYRKYLEKLLSNGRAFWCNHDQAFLENEQKEQSSQKQAPRHICDQKGKAESGEFKERSVIRLGVDAHSTEKIMFEDIVRGHVEFEARLVGDIVIAKDLSTPLFHFVVVVDDYEMTISHVIRGEEHLANTPKHILLQRALEFSQPIYVHLPLILAPDRSKLSKRHGATSLTEYIEKGYLPEAVLNYLFLLGFSPPDGAEILTLGEMIQCFDITAVHKAGAIFDIKKLDWINGEYIKKMSDSELAKHLERFLRNVETSKLIGAVPLMRQRMKTLGYCKDFLYLFQQPEYEALLLKWKKSDLNLSAKALAEVRMKLADIEFTSDSIRAVLEEVGVSAGERGLAYWPLRVALSGASSSPDPIELSLYFGKEEVIKRIDAALQKIS